MIIILILLYRNKDKRIIKMIIYVYTIIVIFISYTEMNPNTLSKEQYKNLTNAWSNETALPLTINEHDIIFWFGDLNYRIKDIISAQLVFDIINRGEFRSLLQKDQLISEVSSGNVFEGYDEGMYI